MRVRAFLIVIAGILLLPAWVFAAEEPDGRALYLKYQCWQCHGYEGQGGAAARIASKQYSFEAFARYVRHPNVMPAYPAEILTDADLRRILEFIMTIPDPAPLKDIPLLGND